MKRRAFFSVLSAFAITSCARMEKRGARYDEKQCPFCSTNSGVCSYCHGTKECTFCKGKGTRQTTTPTIEAEKIKKTSYEEKCPYCKGTGMCRYCEGSGKCWACDGAGRVESWDFYEKYKKLKQRRDSG